MVKKGLLIVLVLHSLAFADPDFKGITARAQELVIINDSEEPIYIDDIRYAPGEIGTISIDSHNVLRRFTIKKNNETYTIQYPQENEQDNKQNTRITYKMSQIMEQQKLHRLKPLHIAGLLIGVSSLLLLAKIVPSPVQEPVSRALALPNRFFRSAFFDYFRSVAHYIMPVPEPQNELLDIIA